MSKFSTTAELVEPATQQIFAKQKSAGLKTWILAVSTALAVLGTAPFAQAAIVKGTISGTWNSSAHGDLKLGDFFTATYEYDDDTKISSYNNSGTDYSNSEFEVGLSSLVVTSGTYSHTFGVGSGTFSFEDSSKTAPTYTPYSYQFTGVSWNPTGLGSNYFYAYRESEQDNGIPFLNEFASAGIGNGSFASTNSNVNFSPTSTAVTAVPTPALLPSLAAFGLGVWRKRKQAKQVEV